MSKACKSVFVSFDNHEHVPTYYHSFSKKQAMEFVQLASKVTIGKMECQSKEDGFYVKVLGYTCVE